MPLSTDINLPRDTEPIWPDRCVCCGRPAPGATVRVWTHSIGWSTLIFWHFGALYSVKASACPPCGRRYWIMRIAKLLVNVSIACAGVAIAFWILGSYKGPFRKWLALLITLACLSPYFLWEAFFPPPFDITCFAHTVDYEFRDPDYAAEFESLNRGPVAGDNRQ